jgi:methyl-accepting chemotaxis protein
MVIIERRINDLRNWGEELSTILDKRSDDAVFALAIGGEETTTAVEDTLKTLINVDVKTLQKIYEMQSQVNLAAGVSIALTQTNDTALSEILKDLNSSAVNHLRTLILDISGFDTVTLELERIEAAIEVFDASVENNGVTRAQMRADILKMRSEMGVLLATAIDDAAFNLEINSTLASEENSEAIAALLDDQVRSIQNVGELNKATAKYLGSALETAMSPDRTAATLAQDQLFSQSLRLLRLTESGSDEIKSLVQDLVTFADPETGLFVNRNALLNARSVAVSATQKAAEQVTFLGSKASSSGQTSRNSIGEDATTLLTSTKVIQNQFKSITIVAGILIFASITMTIFWIVRPMIRLTKTTERLATGDLSEILGFERDRSEVGRMAAALSVFRNELVNSKELELSVEAERKITISEQKTVVSNLARGLKKLADGDLDSEIKVPFPDEYSQLREDFNLAISQLNGVIRQAMTSGSIVKDASNEISSASQDLASRAERSAAALEQSAATITQLSSSVNETAENVEGTLSLVEDARKRASSSQDIVKTTVLAMERISETSTEVGKINSMIDDIAFQTNLLALNAGVEAARAGEAGSGFAVVAQEVRALAQRATNAAHEIGSLIARSEAQISEGVEHVSQTEDALKDIGTSVSDVADKVREIALATQEQAGSLSQINVAIKELDQDTQTNAAMLEETTAASINLNDEASALERTVARFKLGIDAEDKPDKSLGRMRRNVA